MSIDVGLEGHALFLDLAQASQGKHLKSTGVGKDRLIPGHKFMQAAHLLYDMIAGTYVQVIGIGQLYLSADALQVLGGNRALDGRYRAYIHKYRCLYRAMNGGKFCSFCFTVNIQYLVHTTLLLIMSL